MQHHLWTQIFGYLLHPSIDLPKKTIKVVGVGAGTGKWLIDLARQLGPEAQLDGFDCDLSQAPPKEWLPGNTRMRRWDMFTDVPDDVIGQYDAVHVKLLVFVVKDDPKPLLHNLLELLSKEPNGWLQWGEPDVTSMRILKSDQSNGTDALDRLFSLSKGRNHHLAPEWPALLADTFTSVGMRDVHLHRAQAEPHLEYAMHQCNLLIYEMIAQKSADKGFAEEVGGLVRRAALETKRGVMFSFSRVTAVGRKPISCHEEVS